MKDFGAPPQVLAPEGPAEGERPEDDDPAPVEGGITYALATDTRIRAATDMAVCRALVVPLTVSDEAGATVYDAPSRVVHIGRRFSKGVCAYHLYWAIPAAMLGSNQCRT